MNNNAGVVGNAPMTPAFFLFWQQKEKKMYYTLLTCNLSMLLCYLFIKF